MALLSCFLSTYPGAGPVLGVRDLALSMKMTVTSGGLTEKAALGTNKPTKGLPVKEACQSSSQGEGETRLLGGSEQEHKGGCSSDEPLTR